jgi:hypothetical protein
MSAFLTYCSVVLHDLKAEESKQSAKLCAIILTCITEVNHVDAHTHTPMIAGSTGQLVDARCDIVVEGAAV